MKQRGRKTGLSLAAVTPIAPTVLPAPASLTADERKVWRATVNSKPAEWFGVEHIPLLESFCRHVCLARMYGRAIEQVPSASLASDDAVLERHERLSKLHEREARAASSLATRMRLTHQSVYDARVAANHSNAQIRESKPWQRSAA